MSDRASRQAAREASSFWRGRLRLWPAPFGRRTVFGTPTRPPHHTTVKSAGHPATDGVASDTDRPGSVVANKGKKEVFLGRIVVEPKWLFVFGHEDTAPSLPRFPFRLLR